MFESYKEDQKISYRILKNAMDTNKFSHAYLIESNGYPNTFDFVLSFAKTILNQDNSNNDILELKIINPDGTLIKKEQIDELQLVFNEKSILGNKKVYIINGVEKMKETTANSLLKFLEEPGEGVIALLITDNIYQLLPTIISRCQLLSLVNNKKNMGNTLENIGKYLFNNESDIIEYINEEKSTENIEKIIQFALNYEKNRVNTILYIKKMWHDNFKDREDVRISFEILLLLYKDALNLKIKNEIEYFVNYNESVELIANSNTKNTLINKINKIRELKEKIRFNVNLGLLMDKLIIELERCYEDD